MNKYLGLAGLLVFAACSSKNLGSSSLPTAQESASFDDRVPASLDLSGHYLGEGNYQRRGAGNGLSKPAVRLYLKKIQGERAYHGVILEYDALQNMALPFLSANKAPALNKVIGYLDKIATRISAYRVVPNVGEKTFSFFSLHVKGAKLYASQEASLLLTLANPQAGEHSLAGAVISGDPEGTIAFPVKGEKKSFLGGLADLVSISQYELASFTYKKGHLDSTWRGDFENLRSSYLSEYGKVDDGVLELYSEGRANKAKFIVSKTKPKHYSNPKSAGLEGEYIVNEVQNSIFVFSPVRGPLTKSDLEIAPRIGVFLDIFDASAPEAGSSMVVELAMLNPANPRDFLMYYQHPAHAKNVGVQK